MRVEVELVFPLRVRLRLHSPPVHVSSRFVLVFLHVVNRSIDADQIKGDKQPGRAASS